MNDDESLGRSRIFDGLTEAERRECLEAGAPIEVRRGQTLARQGEPAGAFYLVGSGLLKLVQVTAEGDELIVRFVGDGEPFGGVVALASTEYPVTALAVETTRLRQWPRETLAALLARHPQLGVNIMREMAAHMTDALTRVRELATERVGQRLAHTLLRLARQCGRQTDEGVLIAHPLTRQELAQLTGATLHTVSRTLAAWQADGVLRSDRRRLLVRSTRRLEALAHADTD
ncbi:MAG TPA: Crp/Fnr family transcriptional regulator [Vicinamibacterales bacterium]|nr:Crp/Fnr family transcriptional regulator [Vicinamibacterales bacterium]